MSLERARLHRGSAQGDSWPQRKQIETDTTIVKGLGGFNGWGGVIYALTHLGVLWNDESLFDEAEDLCSPAIARANRSGRIPRPHRRFGRPCHLPHDSRRTSAERAPECA